MNLIPFFSAYAEAWDALLADVPMSTFLHSRRFLAYHQERFRDVSVLVQDSGDRLIAVFPAALAPDDDTCVVSHPGITYGGLLHNGRLLGEANVQVMEQLAAYYQQMGLKKLTYKAVPYIYHTSPASDDLYSLFRVGAKLYRCDLSCAIEVDRRLPVSQRRKRSLKKAFKLDGLQIRDAFEHVADFWEVLAQNLNEKHGVKPVHSLAEIRYLQQLFPDNIKLVTAVADRQVLAGVLLFITANVVHAQYIASAALGRQYSCLDAVFDYCIRLTADSGQRFFDFGISTEREGQYLNDSLHQFKSEFGGAGVVHHSYEIGL